MVFMEQQSNCNGLPEPVENSRTQGFVTLPCTAGNQQHLTPVAPVKTGATRMASAVSFPSGQCHTSAQIKMMKSDKVIWIFASGESR
jgi:hypothetical protein